jgi:hypothetical protein
MAPPSRIGLDLDNTVIDYTEAYPVIARNLGLPDSCRDRNQIRDLLRVSPPNDFEWQEFQALLYTDGLDYAQPALGLEQFLGECSRRGVRVSIVSHKTPRTPDMFGAHDLHAPAMKWLVTHDVVPQFVTASDVYFCPTRAVKIQTINDVEAEVFVDDLSEVLTDPRLPSTLVRWHFVPTSSSLPTQTIELPTTDFPGLTEWLRTC